MLGSGLSCGWGGWDGILIGQPQYIHGVPEYLPDKIFFVTIRTDREKSMGHIYLMKLYVTWRIMEDTEMVELVVTSSPIGAWQCNLPPPR